MSITQRLDLIFKNITSRKMKEEMLRARAEVIELEKELGDQQALFWFRPQACVPDNGEIVVIACDVDSGDGARAQVLQTAIYELCEDKTEKWHCGQPFVSLIFWCRLPAVPKETIIIPKKTLAL